MIPELGHFALIIALCLAAIQAIFPILGAACGDTAWIAVARPAARAQSLFLVVAFAALTYAFVSNDFSVAYVAGNSNTALPLFYRVSAVWGGHEGSLLLWSVILGLWTLAVSVFNRGLPEPFVARVLGVMGLVSVGFLLFLLLTSNPFLRLFPAPLDGADLNPLLQDIGLIIHPPMLYLGYVGFSVAFGFAIAALLGGRLDASWARWSRPWTTVAWAFLTLGIALGSWWAYYELGWGGWWFWDPVENASFMPWLTGTALIHSLAATEKRGAFKSWTVLLAICAFALSLLGTFLVRSGVLTSVHAFANDPARGVFILGYLTVVIGGSLGLYAWRAPATLEGANFKPVSREAFILLNNLLLMVAMASILLGTLYPLAVDALGLGKLSVGPPYFNTVFAPLMAVLALIMVVGTATRWKQDTVRRLVAQLRYAAVGVTVAGALIWMMMADHGAAKAILGSVLAAWILCGTLVALHAQIAGKRHPWAALRQVSRSFYGMALAHAGLAVTLAGVAVVSTLSTDVFKRLTPGASVDLGGYTFRFDGVKQVQGPNYQANEATIGVFRDGDWIATLAPQKRNYRVQTMPMTEADILPGITHDLYASLGEPLGEDGAWSVRIYYRPLVRWIWFGALLMALGGLLAVSDRRYRLALRRREHAPAPIAPAVPTLSGAT
ncbi:MAG: heme lyase CcmF/NrfE family subunit [Gammaproteobacteria bacterium]